MNKSSRERFLSICHFESSGDLYMGSAFHYFVWRRTLEEWIKQGAPKEIIDPHFRESYLSLDPMIELDIHLGEEFAGRFDIGGGVTWEYGLPPVFPRFEPKIIAEDERTVTVINESGITCRVFREAPDRMNQFVDWPVKDRASWNEFKKRLDPHTHERWPTDWNDYIVRIDKTNAATVLGVGSFFGFLVKCMGLENTIYTFHDDPNLIEDIMDQICYMVTEGVKRVIKDGLRVDMAAFWEDMAYKTGPMISPTWVMKFMLPRYRKVTDLLHKAGIDVIFVDSDGNISELIPLWLEVGINLMFPLEVAAGNDAVELRKTYGKNLILAGNIDKRALIKGKDAIRKEVMSKVPFLLESGGYFPSIDHVYPPDLTWENFVFFINTLREVAGLEKLPG